MSSTDPTEWRKSSFSGANGNCVEMRSSEGGVQVRDSKQHGTGPILNFTTAEFNALLQGVKAGEFDHLG